MAGDQPYELKEGFPKGKSGSCYHREVRPGAGQAQARNAHYNTETVSVPKCPPRCHLQ